MDERFVAKSDNLARFFRKDDGTATVEAVLWFPIFIAVFGLMVDAAMIFNGQSRVLRVVQDANRNLSIGRFNDETITEEEETEQYINTILAGIDITPSKTDAVISSAGVVTTTVEIPARQMMVLGYFSSLLDLRVSVTADHMLENWEG